MPVIIALLRLDLRHIGMLSGQILTVRRIGMLNQDQWMRGRLAPVTVGPVDLQPGQVLNIHSTCTSVCRLPWSLRVYRRHRLQGIYTVILTTHEVRRLGHGRNRQVYPIIEPLQVLLP